jgi:hypothetical protein
VNDHSSVGSLLEHNWVHARNSLSLLDKGWLAKSLLAAPRPPFLVVRSLHKNLLFPSDRISSVGFCEYSCKISNFRRPKPADGSYLNFRRPYHQTTEVKIIYVGWLWPTEVTYLLWVFTKKWRKKFWPTKWESFPLVHITAYGQYRPNPGRYRTLRGSIYASIGTSLICSNLMARMLPKEYSSRVCSQFPWPFLCRASCSARESGFWCW